MKSHPPRRNSLIPLFFCAHNCSLFLNWYFVPDLFPLDFTLRVGEPMTKNVFIQFDRMGIYLCICKEANTFLNMFELSIIRHHLYII